MMDTASLVSSAGDTAVPGRQIQRQKRDKDKEHDAADRDKK